MGDKLSANLLAGHVAFVGDIAVVVHIAVRVASPVESAVVHIVVLVVPAAVLVLAIVVVYFAAPVESAVAHAALAVAPVVAVGLAVDPIALCFELWVVVVAGHCSHFPVVFQQARLLSPKYAAHVTKDKTLGVFG